MSYLSDDRIRKIARRENQWVSSNVELLREFANTTSNFCIFLILRINIEAMQRNWHASRICFFMNTFGTWNLTY